MKPLHPGCTASLWVAAATFAVLQARADVAVAPPPANVPGAVNELENLPPAPPIEGTPAPPIVSSAAPSTTAPASPQATPPQIATRQLFSAVPLYVDRGVTMVPLRPLCEFSNARLRLQNNSVSIQTANTRANVLIGKREAQVETGTAKRKMPLSLPLEARLQSLFAPLRFAVEVLNLRARLLANGDVALQGADGRQAVLHAPQPRYQGGDAARVTIHNGIGRALSLHLTGPQRVALELGQGATLRCSLKPGVYYFRAGATGMRVVTGARRLPSGRSATWSWGRG